MRKYELAVLLHPDLEIDLDAPLKRLDDIIKNAGGKIEKRDNWGKRKLAYNIKGQEFAVYLFYVIEAEPSATADLESALRLNEEVLRHLIVSYDQEAADDRAKEESDADEREKKTTRSGETKSESKKEDEKGEDKES